MVGGGIAGVSAALEARRLAPRKSIGVISDEEIRYARPSLTAVVSGAVTSIDQIAIFGPLMLKTSRIDSLTGYRVSEIDHANRVVYATRTASGRDTKGVKFCFERVIIATGATPYTPKVEGSNLRSVFSIRKFEEALQFSKFMSRGMKGHVVGAGFVGLDTAQVLARRGLEVTLVVRSRILRAILDEDLSEILTKRAAVKKVKIIKGTCLDGIRGKRKVERVVLGDREVQSDFVVFASGVTANSSVAAQTGCRLSDDCAIRTDRQMRTNLAEVYAAGDCCQTLDFITGRSVYRPIGSIAVDTAKIAGANAVGSPAEYEGTIRRQYNKIFGTEVLSMGLSIEEARSLDINARSFEVKIKKPQFMPSLQFIEKNRMKIIVDLETDRVIGWQALGMRYTSFLSVFMYDCIFCGKKLGEIQDSGLNIEVIFE